jgi:adenylate kinase family enzyme
MRQLRPLAYCVLSGSVPERDRTRMEYLQRILIIGNGGTGKTWLAREIGRILNRSLVHLDDVRWMPGRYGVARDNQTVLNDVIEAAKPDTWIMEGVYGWLANGILPRVTTLIWIDLPEEECVANVMARGNQGGGTDEGFSELIDWVRKYRERTNSSTCYEGHRKLYDNFVGKKLLLESRYEVTSYAERVKSMTG